MTDQARAGNAFGARPLVFAHRGARAYAPENTLLAFQLAFDLGADAIECDVRRTADGALVIIHDGTLNRTTNGRGVVASQTLADLRALNAGLGQSIPTLDETLALCAARGRQVNLEVKAETLRAALATAEALEPALSALDAGGRQRVLVSSFDLPAVAHLKQRLPWLRAATLHGAREWRQRDPLAPALAMGAQAVHPAMSLVTPSLVERAHDNGLRIHVWTANRLVPLRQLLSWGVDGVFSDYPERAVIARTLTQSVAVAR
ncbi:MAG TPA: glycerophosphodiester phosphodiesterase family protein [Ktedonobacterales bacterium]|jgi:glycerophosphoryl diester phosphodiesterase|nr:glycerophosphodiester phosphodiesterase family protein [Ktedonobacterales bacterium]